MIKCEACGVEKEESAFYRSNPVCRSCLQPTKRIGGLSFEQKVEARRQERLLKVEIAKLAHKKVYVKTAKKQAVKRQNLEMKKPDASFPETDSATQELARRELSRRRLIEFVKAFHPKYKAGWVHHDICRRLEQFAADVAAEKSPRLMILMPPRHGKSQLASKLYPAWHLGHYPTHEFIACSYNISLALEFSRDVRNVLRSEPYQQLFPRTKLDPNIQSAETWKVLSPTGFGGGSYVAAGIGGGITGKGAHVLVIDDPVKNEEEADSLDTRSKIWNWYLSSAYNRLAPGGGVLVIQTWWHDDDLAGRIQQMMKDNPDDKYVDQFVVVKYPAIAEEDEEFRMKGEALHPERYTVDQLMRIQRQYGGPQSRFWSALYQQNPVPTEGAYFSKDMIQYRDETLPIESMHIYQAWDFAISEEQQKGGNWTVGVTVGLDHNDMVHVLERVRIKTNDSAAIEDQIIDMYARYRQVTGIGFEDGQIFKTMKASLQRRMKERHVYIPLDTKANILKPVREKEVRARPLQARLQNRKVTFPRGQVWVDEMWRELLRFPAGVQDDQVDAMAWVVQLLLGRSPPSPPKLSRGRTEKTVAQKLQATLGGGRSSGHMAA
jgi:predicted phage terminase large subunit-like protein